MYVMARRVAMYVVQAVVVVVVFSGDSYKSIAFCSIRGGGRGSGGVILYEKKITTDLAPVILPSKKKYQTNNTKHKAM